MKTKLSDEMKAKLEMYCHMIGADKLYILDCDIGLFPVLYAFQHKEHAFECVLKAAEAFYGSIYPDNEIPDALGRVREAVEANLYIYHQDPSVWGENIRCVDLPEVDCTADCGFDSLPQEGNGIVGDDQCAFINFAAHVYEDLREIVVTGESDKYGVYLIFNELSEEKKAAERQTSVSFITQSGFRSFRWNSFSSQDERYKALKPIAIYKKREERE